MRTIAILCALPQEIQPFQERIALENEELYGSCRCWSGHYAGQDLILLLTGIGKVQAAVAAQHAISHYAADTLFSCGTAGGLDPRCRIGDIVVSSTNIQHDYGFMVPEGLLHFGIHMLRKNRKRKFFTDFDSDKSLVKKARQLSSRQHESPRAFVGPILSGDQVIFSSQKRQTLAARFNALAVDMESAAIAQVCQMHMRPFLSIRGISDRADENIELDGSKIDPDEFADYRSPFLRPEAGILARTICYLAQHPSQFTLSFQARQNMEIASEHSAEFTLRLLETV